MFYSTQILLMQQRHEVELQALRDSVDTERAALSISREQSQRLDQENRILRKAVLIQVCDLMCLL